VDDKRIYASGYSMGGYGTWNLLMNHSDVFCAAVAMCGAADPSQAATLVDIPVWAIHGVKDPTVPVSGSQEMVAAIQAAGGTKIRYTELPDHEHDVWSYTYTDPEIFNWLFAQVKE
jgi:predicted peptidase